jgi:hypothetical protein
MKVIWIFLDLSCERYWNLSTLFIKNSIKLPKSGFRNKISQVTNSPLANGIGYTSAYDLKELSIFIKSLSMLTIHDCVYPYVITII